MRDLDIVIVANFCDFSGSNNRFVYLANMLAKNCTVELITSNYSHGTKTHRRDIMPAYPFKVTLLNEPGYPRNICAKRFASHYIWGRNVLSYLKSRSRPDAVYAAVPSLTAANLCADYCSKESIKFIVDVQDLWPEAFRMVFDMPVLSDALFAPFEKVANSVYASADVICAVSNTYANRALYVNSKVSNACVAFLGTDLNQFDEYVSNSSVFGKADGEIWVGYCGSLGSSYDLACAIDAVAMLASSASYKLKLVIIGDGPQRARLERYAIERRANVKFIGRLPYEDMCRLLAICDIAINPIAHNSAGSIINKHADYAAAGLPVVNTQECGEYRDLIQKYSMGINCENGNSIDVAGALAFLAEEVNVRKRMGSRARVCATELFDRSHTYQHLVESVLGVINE